MAGRPQQVNNDTKNISIMFFKLYILFQLLLQPQQPLHRMEQWSTRINSTIACPDAGRQTNGIQFVAATITIITTYKSWIAPTHAVGVSIKSAQVFPKCMAFVSQIFIYVVNSLLSLYVTKDLWFVLWFQMSNNSAEAHVDRCKWLLILFVYKFY